MHGMDTHTQEGGRNGGKKIVHLRQGLDHDDAFSSRNDNHFLRIQSSIVSSRGRATKGVSEQRAGWKAEIQYEYTVIIS